jgi:RNA polymerase sigma-70 factor (ECF subfamily)
MRSNFENIYEEHKNKVYNLSLSYVQNCEDAQEITQDVFVSVYQSLDNFKHQSQISTWIYRITINKALDFIKAKKRKKRFAFITSILNPDGSELVNTYSHFDHPGVKMEQKEAIESLFTCINKLPDNQKTALLLAKIENKKQLEIAEIMQMSHKAVESLIQRAKKNLSKQIELSKDKF